MTLSKSHSYFTPESYLELEWISPVKHEYLQGQMVAMAGASEAHVILLEISRPSLSISFVVRDAFPVP